MPSIAIALAHFLVGQVANGGIAIMANQITVLEVGNAIGVFASRFVIIIIVILWFSCGIDRSAKETDTVFVARPDHVAGRLAPFAPVAGMGIEGFNGG